MTTMQRIPLNQPLPWLVAVGLFIFVVFFFLPFKTSVNEPSASRLAFHGKTLKPLEWVEMCLGKNWGGQLNLRHRKAPSEGTARLDNPVRHYVIDVRDDGTSREMLAYSRRGEPFREAEVEALDGCLTGAAPALGDPRNQ